MQHQNLTSQTDGDVIWLEITPLRVRYGGIPAYNAAAVPAAHTGEISPSDRGAGFPEVMCYQKVITRHYPARQGGAKLGSVCHPRMSKYVVCYVPARQFENH